MPRVEGDRKDSNQSQTKRPYQSPNLKVYGEVRVLTAAGSAGIPEAMVGGKKT